MEIDISTLKALSIRQPWCHYILEHSKDIENRNWHTHFRGDVLIHASKKFDGYKADQRNYEEINGPLDYIGIVGIMTITDCVSKSDSRWFNGSYGFVIANAQPIPFIPCKGALSFFKPQIEEGKYYVRR